MSSVSVSTTKFIVYACPTGQFNSLLEDYFRQSLKLYGENTAHKYMPHCTLTGFFTADIDSIPIYIQALDLAYTEAKNENLPLDITVKQLTFNENWHGLELQGENLKQLIVDFSGVEKAIAYREKLRLKDWLHLSLAYNFAPQHNKKLEHLARDTIDIEVKNDWELRFYQKNPDWSWNCLKSWQL
ncbi:MAG: hypothetical protein AAGE96_22695 [Cyanobacteria bacterium P01_G01_bin.19]